MDPIVTLVPRDWLIWAYILCRLWAPLNPPTQYPDFETGQTSHGCVRGQIHNSTIVIAVIPPPPIALDLNSRFLSGLGSYPYNPREKHSHP